MWLQYVRTNITFGYCNVTVMMADKRGLTSGGTVFDETYLSHDQSTFRDCEVGSNKMRYHNNDETTWQLTEHKTATGNELYCNF